MIDTIISEDHKEDAKSYDSELYRIMDNQYGNYVIQKAIEKSTLSQRAVFTTKIKAIEEAKKESKEPISNYAKHVISCLDK